MIRCSRSTTLRSAGGRPNRPAAPRDMLLAELDPIVALAAVPGTKAEGVFGLVGALEDRRKQHIVRLGRIVWKRPAAPGHRDHARDLEPVDGDDVVAGLYPRGFGLRPDREADPRQVVLVEREPSAAADDQRAVLAGLVEAVPDAGNRAGDRQQQGRDPEQLEQEQPAPFEVGDSIGQDGPGRTGSVSARRGIRRHDCLMPPLLPPPSH